MARSNVLWMSTLPQWWLCAAIGFVGAWQVREPFPGVLAVLSACVVAYLLDRSPLIATRFVTWVHVIRGPYRCCITVRRSLGRVVAATATLATSLSRGLAPERSIFNTAQRALSVMRGAFVYQIVFGGASPPSFLLPAEMSAAVVQRDLFLFFALAGTYVVANKMLVAGAAALRSGRPFREVWHLNSRGISAMIWVQVLSPCSWRGFT